VTLNFNNSSSITVVFLDTEKAFDITWHSGLLYELSQLQFSASIIKLLVHSFLRENSDFQFEGEMSTSHEILGGVPHGSMLSPTPYNLYINDSLETPGVHLAIFW
jgi:hypothetical protein